MTPYNGLAIRCVLPRYGYNGGNPRDFERVERTERKNIQTTVTHEVTQWRRKPNKKLTEVGGLALVEFHLARRGAEFARTRSDSDHGDIWADCGGRKIAIEVKTTFESSGWHVKRQQNRADFYCLVHLEEAKCYVLSTEAMQQILANAADIFPGIGLVKRTSLPPDCAEKWNDLGLNRLPGVWLATRNYRSTRRVTHTLKSGELRTYVYPPGE